MKEMSIDLLKNRIKKLIDENIKAKNFVKRGEFRKLSKQLEEILDNSEINIFFQKNFFLENEEYKKLEKKNKLRLDYEILRYKLFLFQHLSYYDALTQKKTIGSVALNVSKEEREELESLFNRLNKFSGKDKNNSEPIVTKDSIQKEAKSAYEEIRKNSETKSSWEIKDEIEKKVWQEKVWLVLCYLNEQFHLDKFDECLAKLERIKEFVFGKIADEENSLKENPFFCFTTKATILSLIANCQAMKGLHEAESNYYEAIKFYTFKAKNPKDTNDDDENAEVRLQNNIKFQFRRTAQIFVYGLLKVNAKKSNIDRCKANLLITELLLTEQKDDETTWLVLEFSKLVIKRIEAGVDTTLLKDIRENLSRVKEKLELLAHKPLLAEINFELAIINHLLKNWEISESLLKEVEDYYEDYEEILYRMKANISILRSHMKKSEGNLPKAIEYAKEGMSFSKMSNNVITKMDAAICLAESCFENNKLGNETKDDAYKLFQRALTLNEQMQSPKIEAICLLGLCKIAAFRKEQEKAKSFYNSYLTIKQFCQHKFVFDSLEPKAKAELDILTNNFFVINKQTDGLNYEENVERLKFWLFFKAMEESSTDSDIADKLGISRQSVIAWKKSFDLSKKKK